MSAAQDYVRPTPAARETRIEAVVGGVMIITALALYACSALFYLRTQALAEQLQAHATQPQDTRS